MKISNETLNEALKWDLKELYTYIKALSIDEPEIEERIREIKNGITLKIDINYYTQPSMNKHLTNKGRKVYLHKKYIGTLEELYEELETRKSKIINMLIEMQRSPSLTGR